MITSPSPPPADRQVRIMLRMLGLLLAVAGACLLLPLGRPPSSMAQTGGSGGPVRGSGASSSYHCTCNLMADSTMYGDGDPVELWRGELVWSQTDLVVNGPVPLALARFHKSEDYSAGPFGP